MSLAWGVKVHPAPDSGKDDEYSRHEGKSVVPPNSPGAGSHPKPRTSDDHSHSGTYGVNDCMSYLD
jgi:hypothetical protein